MKIELAFNHTVCSPDSMNYDHDLAERKLLENLSAYGVDPVSAFLADQLVNCHDLEIADPVILQLAQVWQDATPTFEEAPRPESHSFGAYLVRTK